MIANQVIGSGHAQFEFLNFGFVWSWLSSTPVVPDPDTATYGVTIDRTYFAIARV